MYMYVHQGSVWTDNKMHGNHLYDFNIDDDCDYLTVARNEIHPNANHGALDFLPLGRS